MAWGKPSQFTEAGKLALVLALVLPEAQARPMMPSACTSSADSQFTVSLS